jgi:3-methyladenine DNA glycosylase AlkC
MAKKFKDYYDTDCAKLIAHKIRSVRPSFNEKEFVSFVAQKIPRQEFMQRQDTFVDAFEAFLSSNYTRNLKLFKRILGAKLQVTAGMFTTGWWLWPVGRYVERHALLDVDASVDFIYELTQRFTGEFAIRPLLATHPEIVLRRVKQWSKDANVHVRRLSSEGIRIRLPWAAKSTVFLEHYPDCAAILSNLRFDTEKFVQKSVGNNINDLLKENEQLGMDLIHTWINQKMASETKWIIRHGLRTLRKKNRGSALALLSQLEKA